MPVITQPSAQSSWFIGSQLSDFIASLSTLAPLITDGAGVVHVHLAYAAQAQSQSARVVLSMISGPEGDTTSLDAAGLTDSRWQFECYAATQAAAEAIANALINDALGYTGTLAGGATIDVVEVLDTRGPDYVADILQFRCDVDLSIRF